MADLAFLEAKIVCGGAWGNDKMVWGFIGEVVVRRCSALWVQRLGEDEVVGRRCSALLVLRREGGWGAECSEVL